MSEYTFKDSEDSIVTRLAPLNDAEIDTIVLPDMEVDLVKASIARPRVVVSFDKSHADRDGLNKIKHGGMSTIIQDEHVQFLISIQSKFRLTDRGIYNILRLVKLLLIGFKPTMCDKMYFIDFMLTGRSENLWTYGLSMGCRTYIVEDEDAEQLVAEAILKMTVNDNTSEETFDLESEA